MKSIGNSDGHPIEWYLRRIDYLSQFMLPERAQTLRQTLELRTRYMTVCTENTFDPHNASALVRHCEAFGLQDLYAIEQDCAFSPSTNVVKGTDKWVDLHRYRSGAEGLDALRESGYRIIATTPHLNDRTPEDFDVEAGPFALIFGAERDGISPRVAERADGFIRIPMVGFVESLNVSASAAILIYMLSRRLRASSVDWRLPEHEKAEILFRWMASSVRYSRRLLDQMPQ